MENEIICREYRTRELDSMTELLCRAGGYEKMLPADTAQAAAKVDLLGALITATFIRVAEKEGKPVGFLIGSFDVNTVNMACVQQIMAAKAILGKKKFSGTEASLYKKLDSLNLKLLKKCRNTYESELSLFVLAEEERGKGVGKELYSAFLAHLRESSKKKFYLKADSRIDGSVYERFGMKKKETEKTGLLFKKSMQAEVSVYEGEA